MSIKTSHLVPIAAALTAAFAMLRATPVAAADAITTFTDHSLLLITTFGLLLALTLLGLLYLRLRNSNRRAVEAEMLLKTAIDNISDGFAIYDANDRLVLCNEQLRAMYPAIADRIVVGAKCTDLAHALCESAAATNDDDAIKQNIAKLTHGIGETEMQLDDGRWVLHRDRKLPDGGKVGVRTDITQMKAREQVLQDSAMRYYGLVERSPVPIFVHREGEVLYANSATADILGFASAQEVLGKNLFDLVHPDHHKLVMKRMSQALGTDGSLSQVGMKFVRADGSSVHTEARVSQVEYDGKPALESILHDISVRRRTERALMESEQRYRNLFELSPDAILVHDGEHILFANKTAAHMLGAPSDTSLFGSNVLDLMPPSSQDTCLLFNEGGNDAAPQACGKTCKLQRLDGDVFDAEIVTASTNYHGQQVHQAVIRDVTERIRMDANMTQNAKLASLGGMAAGLAHELSQPLNIMRFAAEGGLLKMSKRTLTTPQHVKNYELIQAQAERMAAVMDNMRIFSRKDPGPMQVFDLPLAVRNISHLVRNPFRVDDVHIELLGPVSGIMAMGNTIQFEQVVLNLLNNARDSILEHRANGDSDEPGRITIECQVGRTRGDAVITVSDNGGGIDPQILGRIFDPFFTTKDVGQGTGLGLALSHEIITAMSGSMVAHNTDDGARFTMRVPLSEATLPNTVPANDERHVLERAPMVPPKLPVANKAALVARHILVVEDEVEAARALADFLMDEGFKVSVAHNGHEGLVSYRATQPDVVITDIRMPGMDGASLIKLLRAERADLPIIAVTGHMGDTEEIDAGPGLQPVKIMKKPVSLMELYRKIGEICAA